MYLRAISLGYAVPDGNFSAALHSVFHSSLNLRLHGESHLLTVFASNAGDLPQGIRIETPEGFSFETFQIGEPVVCQDGLLRFENSSLTVQLTGARRWKCDLPAVGRTASPTYLSNWRFVWAALNERQKRSEAEIVAERLFHESVWEAIPRRAGEAMRNLLQITRRYDLTDISVLRALIGLGSGLTPSGDDLLMGYLAGLWCTVHDRSERRRFISSLGQRIAQLSSKTNEISHTYLHHAAQGQVSSQLADLAEAICRGEAVDRLSGIAEAAMQAGHTSGMDAVTGLLVGLSAWTDVKPKRQFAKWYSLGLL